MQATRVVRRLGRCCALALLLCHAAPAIAAPQWRRVDSPNFIVIGDVSAGQLRRIAVQFEAFREVLGRVLNEQLTISPVPTVVIVFPHDGAFTPYKPTYEGKPVAVGGVFYEGRDVNYITLLADSHADSLRTIFHEYAHLVISNLSVNLPVWLNEGLAEFYSTFTVEQDGRRATLGVPVDSHLRVLLERTLLPLPDLLKVDRESPLYNEGLRRSVFYAQSWALTHMLMLGEPPRRDKLAAFVSGIGRGASEAEGWQHAFGGDRLDQDLQNYAHRQVFRGMRYTFSDRIATFDAAPAALAHADVQAFLAGLRLRQQRLEDAENLLAPVLQKTPDHTQANAMMAQAELQRGRDAAALARLTRLAPADDWFAAYVAGVALSDLAERHGGPPPADLLQAARRHLETARRRNELANVLARLAGLDLASGEAPSDGTRALVERARALAPGRDDYTFVHARVLARQRSYAAARATLGPLMSPAAQKHVRESARLLMTHILGLEASDRAAAEGRSGAAPPVASAPATGAPAPIPESGTVIYDFRRLQAGEHRAEGLLERIECTAAGGPAFHVRDGDARAVFTASNMGEVDFIAYRNDLTGTVSCGPLKTPMRVYVTWRAGPKDGERLVVAIEFLPK